MLLFSEHADEEYYIVNIGLKDLYVIVIVLVTGGANENRRRDTLTILSDVLNNTLWPTKFTHILFRTNLSYMQLRKYLDMLLEKGLVEELPGGNFVITDSGRLFLELLPSPLVEGHFGYSKQLTQAR